MLPKYLKHSTLYWKTATLFYFCHLKKLVRQETFGPTLVDGDECGALVERYWQWENELLGENPVQTPLCPT